MRTEALVLAVMLTVAVAPTAQADEFGLVGQWHLDTLTASPPRTTPDSSGNGLTATSSEAGVPTVGPGRFANAFTFSANTQLAVANNPVLEPPRVSVLLWMKRSSPADPYEYLLAKGAVCGIGASYGVYTGVPGDVGLRFFIMSNSGGPSVDYITPNAGTAMFDGNWHAVAGTYDGSAVRLYVDGTQIASTPTTVPIQYGTPGNYLSMGSFDTSCGGSDDQYDGSLDDVRIYNRALTPEEIAYLSRPDHATPPSLPIPSPETGLSPPPPPLAANLTAPAIETRALNLRTRQRVYECLEGTWSNLASDPQFKYTWWQQGRPSASGTPRPDFRVDFGSDRLYELPKRDIGRTFYCEVAARGSDGNLVRAVSTPRILTGESDSVTPPSTTKGEPPYGNVRIRGIDVFQVVQPNNLARKFDASGPFTPNWCGGGTPTSFQPVVGHCEPAGGDPTQTTYHGVTLDANKRTLARVYLNMVDAKTPFPRADIPVTLTAFLGGQGGGGGSRRGELGEDPWGRAHDPPVTSIPYVTSEQRANGSFSVQFELNPYWVALAGRDSRQPFDLEASVTVGGRAAGATGANDPTRECLGTAAADCAADNRFRLNHIPVVSLPTLGVESIEMLTREDRSGPTGAARSTLSEPDQVLSAVRRLFPGGERLRVPRFSGLADIDKVERLTAGSPPCAPFPNTDAGVRACRMAYVDGILDQWISKNGAARRADFVLGVHRYHVNTSGPFEPGFQTGPPLAPRQRFAVKLAVNDGNLKRPLTAAAREFGHALGAPNAGTACSTGEPWPDDEAGRLQGVAFDAGRPRVDGLGSTLFDLMSFCAPEAGAWLSPFNWNRTFETVRKQPASGPTGLGLAIGAQAGQAFASGVVGPNGAKIVSITPADADNLAPAPDPASPLRVRTSDAGGRELAVVGAAIQTLSEAPGAGTFAVAIPAGAATVELLIGGQTVDRKVRSRAPKVRVLAPRAGRRVGANSGLRVRWASSDPDRDALDARVEFAANGRSGWRTIFTGPDTGSATIPGRLLERAAAARVRVRVSDGFNEVGALSGRFRTEGRPPTARILAPQLSELRSQGRTLLAGSGLDDRGVALRTLTWFAGRRRLGRGSELRVTLPAGRVTLRLVARDRFGRVGTAVHRLKVDPLPLQVTKLVAPAHVAAGAKTVPVTLATSLGATLRAGGRQFVVGRQARRISIPLPRSPRRGVLKVKVALAAHGVRQPGVIDVLAIVRS